MAKRCPEGKVKGCVTKKAGKKSTKKTSTKSRKVCQNKSTGRLKKGWRYGKNGSCVKAKA